MKQSTYDELKFKLDELLKQRAELQKTIHENEVQIHETQCFADEILNKDEEDFKVFSPRKHEDLYRNELDQSYGKKASIQKENDVLIAERDKLDSMIHLLEEIASDFLSDQQVNKSNDEDVDVQNHENKSTEENDEQSIVSDEMIQPVSRESIYVSETESLLKRTAYFIRNISVHKLSRINHKLDLSTKFIGQDPMRTKVELNSVRKNIGDIITELQELMYDLCPMGTDDHFDFKDSCEKLLADFNSGNDYEMDIKCEAITCDDEMKLRTLYRVVMEALSNIKKHAAAKKVTFVLEQVDDKISITIRDDGKGFIVSDSCGIVMMRERVSLSGGSFQIDSGIGKGTTIGIIL